MPDWKQRKEILDEDVFRELWFLMINIERW